MAVPLKITLRSLVVRRTSTLLTVGGLGLIVMALTVVWGLQQGLSRTFRVGGDERVLLVLRGGSTTETTSGLLDETARIIQLSEGVDAGADGKPLAAGESVIIINIPRRGAEPGDDGSSWAVGANVLVRGIDGQRSLELRPGARITEGRLPEPGRNELIVSESIAERFAGCGLGETLSIRRVPFTVVGTFTATETPYDSEIWADVRDLGAAYSRQGAVSSVLMRVSDPVTRASLTTTLEADPRLNVDVVDQVSYFESMSSPGDGLIALGVIVTLFLSIGACFAAANTMYASVLSRTKEIGTLRALGFGRLSILAAFLLESVVVALMAGVAGLLLGAVVLAFAGSAGTAGTTFSEVTFSMRITPAVVLACMGTSAVVGAVGGLLPALRAAMLPITEALRAA